MTHVTRVFPLFILEGAVRRGAWLLPSTLLLQPRSTFLTLVFSSTWLQVWRCCFLRGFGVAAMHPARPLRRLGGAVLHRHRGGVVLQHFSSGDGIFVGLRFSAGFFYDVCCVGGVLGGSYFLCRGSGIGDGAACLSVEGAGSSVLRARGCHRRMPGYWGFCV